MNQRRIFVVTVLAILGIALNAQGVWGQKEGRAIRVFLDCQAPGCDSGHIRTEFGFVNWVRDRSDADVHVLVTAEPTASGGANYRMTLFGLAGAAHDTVQVEFGSAQGATESEQRDQVTNRIGQGLLRYSLNSPGIDRVVVKMREEDDEGAGQGVRSASRDPWKHWIFSAGVDASADGESQQSSREFQMDFSADRVTEAWKIEFDIDGSYRRDEYELEEGRLRSTRRNYSSDLQITAALAPRWSAGIEVEGGTSTFRNQDLYLRFAPLLEYSFLPYSDFSRRRITLQYAIGANRYDYTEVTLFDKSAETVLDERVSLAAGYQQPWGAASAELSASHYFHDLHRYELRGETYLDVRLVRGLALELGAEYSRVHDQLYIRKGDATDEDVLLERLALATGYEYRFSVGMRYTFGSIYSSIVNRRLD